jgi:hypothetical protein
MTTTGMRARVKAARSAAASSLVTTIAAWRPAVASSRAHAVGRFAPELRCPRGRMLTTTATPASAAASTTPCNTSV